MKSSESVVFLSYDVEYIISQECFVEGEGDVSNRNRRYSIILKRVKSRTYLLYPYWSQLRNANT